MKSLEPLKEIAAFYQAEGLTVTSEEGHEKGLLSVLNIHLGMDSQKRENLLRISCVPQHFRGAIDQGPHHQADAHHQSPSHWKFSFEMEFPFKSTAKTASEVAHTLAFINTLLELPGLSFNEMNHTLFYRYVLLTKHHGTDKALVFAITGAIQLITDIYSGLIEQISTGKLTFNDLLEKILASEKSQK